MRGHLGHFAAAIAVALVLGAIIAAAVSFDVRNDPPIGSVEWAQLEYRAIHGFPE